MSEDSDETLADDPADATETEAPEAEAAADATSDATAGDEGVDNEASTTDDAKAATTTSAAARKSETAPTYA